MNILQMLYILLGGAVGTGFRYVIGIIFNANLEKAVFPYATFTINIIGSFLIGFLAELFDVKFSVSTEVRAGILIGVLGGFTTFSSFSLETFVLIQNGRLRTALFYSLGSIAIGLISVWFGVYIARQL